MTAMPIMMSVLCEFTLFSLQPAYDQSPSHL
jgi:hypothetical protein